MKTEDLKKLLHKMSLEEKIGQMVQIPAPMLIDGGIITGPTDSIEMTPQKLSLVGSILGKAGAEDLKDLQEKFIRKHPHHIPLLFMYDVINGMETIFPIPLAQGCTFSPALVEELSAASALESTAKGLHATFSPMLDLVRDARWGRVMESTGEDPFLNSRMGEAMVRGYQGSNLKNEGKLAGCVKHFAGYGAPEGGRDYENAELSEHTLREDYFPAYQAAIEAGCAMVMTSFNTLNRIPSSGNQWLMRRVLREEMKFDGVLISDYGALDEMIVHGFAQNSKEAARLAILAGVDIDMVSNAYVKYLEELVHSGEVSESLIDEAVLRILNLKNELGLFENPYKDASTTRENHYLMCQEHRRLARRAACESFVLLKNEQLLPLSKTSSDKIALIGPYVESTQVFGSWSFPSDREHCVTIHQGAAQKRPNLRYAEGSYILDSNQCTRYAKTAPYNEQELNDKIKSAVETAASSDIVVLCLGEHRDQSGEGGSRASINLPADQMKLLRSIHEVNQNLVTVIFSGRPLELKEVSKLSKSVLMVWMPGTESGNAIADVLFGDQEPGGRLSMCIPASVGQLPIYYNKFMTGRPNTTGTTVRFNHGYIDESTLPLYPFGYGLTYTGFSYSDISLSSPNMYPQDTLVASVTVKNTGSRSGTEVVQLYLRDVTGSVVRPIKMLKGFQKITLAPGESRKVSFSITEPMLKFYDIHMNFTSEPGEFLVFIGPNSEEGMQAAFRLLN